mmetsp:Transcript_35130/g.63791  ORF Transcript_35130/g.63791 Transcript_35130/m.63791 type:complete len:469 (+) Transcript_35130:66-1472(+)
MASLLEKGKGLVGYAAAATEEHRASLKETAGTVLEKAQNQAGNVLEKAQNLVESRHALGDSLKGLLSEGVDLQELKDAGFGMAGNAYRERKTKATLALLNLGTSARVKVLMAVREYVKDAAVADPDMWSCASTRIKDLIDVFWDDLAVYIETMENDQKEVVRGRQIANVEGLAVLGKKPCICSPSWWRALLLYYYLPFDISLFGQVKQPLFWLLTVLSMVPSYGIRILFFAVLFLLHLTACPPDEYQLIGYILTFKGTQFLSSGIGMACFAAVKYYICIEPDGTHTCATNGPGANSDLVSSSIDFLGSCVLVWVAFLVLPCSTRYAGVRDIGEGEGGGEEEQKKCLCCFWNPKRGGRLAGLLGYDLFVFLLSCGLLYGLVYTDTAHLRPGEKADLNVGQDDYLKEINTWQFRTAVFWARVFYSVLAFPFTIFYLPVLNGILTHTTATGYNRQGLCVPYLLHPMPKGEE